MNNLICPDCAKNYEHIGIPHTRYRYGICFVCGEQRKDLRHMRDYRFTVDKKRLEKLAKRGNGQRM